MRFKLALVTVLGILYTYIGYGLFGRLSQPVWIQSFEWLLLGLCFGLIGWLPLVHWNQEAPQDRMEWAAQLSSGLVSFLLFFCLIRDLLVFPVHHFYHLQFFLYGGQATGVIFSSALGCIAVGMALARGAPEVKRVQIAFPNLHPGLHGLRIAQISDLHIGPTIKKAFVQRVVEITNLLGADLVALTGDIVDGDLPTLGDDIQPLSRLSSALGTFYVTGNHEYYWGVAPILSALTSLGITPLINDQKSFVRSGATWTLAGVTDPSAAHFDPPNRSDPARALGSESGSDFKVLLAHQPKTAEAAEKAGFDLQLSGHTHGGQFIPWTWVVNWIHQFPRGLGRLRKLQVYVNLGTGYWGPPIRLGAPSEITLITIVPTL